MNERYDWYEWYDRMNVAMTVSEMVVVPSMLRLGEKVRATATLISMGDGVLLHRRRSGGMATTS